MTTKIYKYKQDVWDKAKCERESKRKEKNGYGDAWPHKGLVQAFGTAYPQYGTVKFNGGTVIEGKWYDGWSRPYPKVHKDFELIDIPSWGIHIVKKQKVKKKI